MPKFTGAPGIDWNLFREKVLRILLLSCGDVKIAYRQLVMGQTAGEPSSLLDSSRNDLSTAGDGE